MTDPSVNAYARRKTIIETLYNVDADFEKDGWDQPSRLFVGMMFAQGEPVDDSSYAWGLSLQEVPLGDLGTVPPPYWLAGLTNIFSVKVQEPGESYLGWALVTEAWSTSVHVNDSERYDEVLDLVQNRELHTLPENERIELRIVMFATRDGEQVALMHERDSVVKEHCTIATPFDAPSPPYSGDLWEGLTYLAQNIKVES